MARQQCFPSGALVRCAATSPPLPAFLAPGPLHSCKCPSGESSPSNIGSLWLPLLWLRQLMWVPSLDFNVWGLITLISSASLISPFYMMKYAHSFCRWGCGHLRGDGSLVHQSRGISLHVLTVGHALLSFTFLIQSSYTAFFCYVYVCMCECVHACMCILAIVLRFCVSIKAGKHFDCWSLPSLLPLFFTDATFPELSQSTDMFAERHVRVLTCLPSTT